MEGRSQRVTGAPTRRQKQAMAAVGGFVVAALAGAAFWGAGHPGSYGRSNNGCITVNVPSSMGGSVMHECGTRARATCRTAVTHRDTLARLIAQECGRAGLGAAPSP